MMRSLLCILGILMMVSCRKNDTQPPSPGRMIKSFQLAQGQYGNAKIYIENNVYKVRVRLTKDMDLKSLTPIIGISDNATISPASGQPIDVSTNKRVNYTITAASGQSRIWEVEFEVYELNITDYGTYSIASAVNNWVIQVDGNHLFNEKYLTNAGINASNAVIAEGENLKRWQEWDIIYNSTAGDVKFYKLRNLNSGMFLNAGTGQNVGEQVRQKTELKTSIDEQLWAIEESLEPGKYQISNKANGLYLTMSGSGMDTKITQETIVSGDKQKWHLTNLPRDSYRDDDVNTFFNRTTGSIAFDQGNSIALSDGRVLWVTQDAWYQNSLVANGNLNGGHTISYTNSIFIQSEINNWDPSAPMMTADGRSHGGIGNLIPKYPGKSWSWPSAGVEIGNAVYIHNREGQGLGTDNDHQTLFKLTPVTATHWDVERTTPPGLTASEKSIGYTSGMVKASDGFVYVFGSRGNPNSFGYETYLHVGRFPQSDPQNWTFWNGNAWESTASTVASHINTGLGTNYVAYLNGKYIHLTMDQGFYCGVPSINMYISTSVSPTGPFVNKKLVHSFTEFYKGSNTRVYTPLIHVESVNGRNELLVTYSINYGACVDNSDGTIKESDGNFDPYYYRVKGVRIPYEKFGM